MKTYITSLCGVALASIALMSCEDIYEGGNKDLPEVAVQMKAQVIPFENDTPRPVAADTKIGVYMVSSESGGAIASNLAMTTDAEGNVDTGNRLYYPSDGTKVNIMCYAPFTAAASEGNLLSLDVSTSQAATASDYLYAANRNKYMALAPVKVQLKHILALAEFNVTAGEGISDDDLNDTSFAFDAMSVKADFDLQSGTLTPRAEGRIPVTMRDNGHHGQCFIMPETVPNVVVACRFKGLNFTKKLGPMEFQSGKSYKFDIVVTEPGFDIVLRQIEDWEVVEY